MSDSKPADGSYRLEESRSVDKEIERLRIQARLGWPSERRVLERAGLADGMAVLDVGMGPGFVTELLLETFPLLRVTGVDFDPAMVESARARLARFADRVELHAASITALPIADAKLDFALARHVFQHLPEPLAGARELSRVLGPGGIVAIHDIDSEVGSFAEPPLPPEFADVFSRAAAVQPKRGGAPLIGRYLPRLLRAAGFVDIDLEMTIVHSDLVGREVMAALWDPDWMWPAVQSGAITEAEFREVESLIEKFTQSPDSIGATTLFCARGRKS